MRGASAVAAGGELIDIGLDAVPDRELPLLSGRPDVAEYILDRVRVARLKPGHVAVLACGPAGLVEAAQAAAAEVGCAFHKESFEI